jgi:hypothetical protein
MRTSDYDFQGTRGRVERYASNAPTSAARPEAFTSPSADDFTALDWESGAFVFGGWKNVLVAVWRSQATLLNVARLANISDTTRWPGRRSSVHVIQDGAGLPTPEARAAFVALMKRNKDSLGCVAIVIAGTGFWSGALRSAMTGLRLLAPRSFDFRVAGSSEDLVQWLPSMHEEKTGVALVPSRLQSVLDTAVAWSAPVR